jgi:hypothetical protein
MGFSSWYDFECTVSAQDIMNTADVMAELVRVYQDIMNTADVMAELVSFYLEELALLFLQSDEFKVGFCCM